MQKAIAYNLNDETWNEISAYSFDFVRINSLDALKKELTKYNCDFILLDAQDITEILSVVALVYQEDSDIPLVNLKTNTRKNKTNQKRKCHALSQSNNSFVDHTSPSLVWVDQRFTSRSLQSERLFFQFNFRSASQA